MEFGTNLPKPEVLAAETAYEEYLTGQRTFEETLDALVRGGVSKGDQTTEGWDMLASEATVTIDRIDDESGHPVITARYSLGGRPGKVNVLRRRMEAARGIHFLPPAHSPQVHDYPIVFDLEESPQARELADRLSREERATLVDLLGVGARVRPPKLPEEFQGENIELTKGICAGCGDDVDPSWATPTLGGTCRACPLDAPVFRPEHVELKVETGVVFDPLIGVHEYQFDWSGTRIKVNGRVGTVRTTAFNASTVDFPDDPEDRGWGTHISSLGDPDLRRIYKEKGGSLAPSFLSLEDYAPTKAELLPEPIAPIEIGQEGGRLSSVVIGSRDKGFQDGRFDFYPTLHKFCNLFVMRKFGLAPSATMEKGFIGRNFEARNHMPGTVYGLNITDHSPLEVIAKARDVEGAIISEVVRKRVYDAAQSKDDVVLRDADAWNVITVWANTMHTLLRYDWHGQPLRTVGDVWEAFCRMQDVALNIMPPETVNEVLAYARKQPPFTTHVAR